MINEDDFVRISGDGTANDTDTNEHACPNNCPGCTCHDAGMEIADRIREQEGQV